MGKLDIDNRVTEDEFDVDPDDDSVTEKVSPMSKDMRRRLEDRLDDARLSRELMEYNFRDI